MVGRQRNRWGRFGFVWLGVAVVRTRAVVPWAVVPWVVVPWVVVPWAVVPWTVVVTLAAVLAA